MNNINTQLALARADEIRAEAGVAPEGGGEAEGGPTPPRHQRVDIIDKGTYQVERVRD